MTMASLTASLLTRRKGAPPQRQSVHAASHAPAGAATGLSADRVTPSSNLAAADRQPQSPVALLPTPNKVRKTKAAAPPKAAAPRKSKTLRLDPKTDLRLRLTAARLDVTQQSIMERGLRALLDKMSPDSRCLYGLTDKTQGGG